MNSKAITIVFLIFTIFKATCFASEQPTWTTNVNTSKHSITLHWAAIYEGFNTVYKISSVGKTIDLQKLEALGQPVFDSRNAFLALPYCEHDGCQAKVNVVDIESMKLLPPIELEYTGQFYVKAKWVDQELEIEVEHSPWGNRESAFTAYRYLVTPKGISIIKDKK